MRYTTFLVAIISATLSPVGAMVPGDDKASPLGAPYGYDIVPMTWSGVIEKGGKEMSFNGTVDEITQQILEIKSDFTWEGLRRDLGTSGPEIHKRSKDGIICGVGGDETPTDYGPYTTNAQDAANSLSATGGNCSVPAGPRVCAVVKCTDYNVGIWLCNDNNHEIHPVCSYLGSYADDIITTCGQNYTHGAQYTRGQEFDSDQYNVVVGWKDQC